MSRIGTINDSLSTGGKSRMYHINIAATLSDEEKMKALLAPEDQSLEGATHVPPPLASISACSSDLSHCRRQTRSLWTH